MWEANSVSLGLSINDASEIGLCLGMHKGRHDVSHFSNATGHGVFTDEGQLAVIA
ncbi:hypothetical protein [Lysinibacillus sp. CTST325]